MNKVNYIPKVNDYVRWKNNEGWIYFKCDNCVTIEINTSPREFPFRTNTEVHYKYHTLLVCYSYNWSELEYVKSRKSKMDT